MVIVSNPRTFKIPDWFLNRQKDHKDGRYAQVTSSGLDTKMRDDLERLKKIRCAPPPCDVDPGTQTEYTRHERILGTAMHSSLFM